MTARVQWVPPGQNPTEFDIPLERPGCFSTLTRWLITGLAIYGFVAIAQNTFGRAAAPEPTSTPTESVLYVTETAIPTPTLMPTPTESIPLVISTPIPTFTPTPTELPQGAIATWTPGPWMLTRYVATHRPEQEVKRDD